MSSERQVTLGEIPPEQATSLLHQEVQREHNVAEVENAVPKFEEKVYRYFTAKHGVVGADLVVQFFLPKEAEAAAKKGDATAQRRWESFWLETFRDQLSPVAQSYFHTDYPHIVAKYTEELASWWFRARGFGETMDPKALAEGFELRLHEAVLQAVNGGRS
ncbi:MAG: hypothetical protein WC372_08395 [Candidatus Neomarinimicrobiota bacterium]|jgi:hypothetical protein